MSYLLGVCLIAIRARTEGRFFEKEYVFDRQNANGQAVFLTDGECAHGVYLTHVTEMMNETEWARIQSLRRSVSFDIPAAYAAYSAELWWRELKDCSGLYEQQQSLANSRMKRNEFTTMDELLKQNLDYVSSQRFYQRSMNEIMGHIEVLEKNDHHADKKVNGFTFKPRCVWVRVLRRSTMKKVEECALCPTNLHINDILIQKRFFCPSIDLDTLFRNLTVQPSCLGNLLPPSYPSYSILSCGTPNAYYYGFSKGGLVDLISEYQQKKVGPQHASDA